MTCENDRSATGYLPKREFEALVDAFFAQPQTSIRGWEPAADAQARIVRAVERIVSQASGNSDLAIVGHGAPEHCSIVALRDCQSIGVTISPRRMVETGSPSTEQAENSCITGGAQSMRQHKDALRVQPPRGNAVDRRALPPLPLAAASCGFYSAPAPAFRPVLCVIAPAEALVDRRFFRPS